MSNRRRIRQEVESLVFRLGRDVEEVARGLERAGVHGVPKSSGECVLARYANAIIAADGRVRSVSVTGDSFHVALSSKWAPPITVPLPRAVRDFIAGFDSLCFPSLVSEPEQRTASV